MSNIFLEKKESLGLSYLDISNKLVPETNRGTVHKYISNPGYWSRKTIIRLANALNIDHDKAVENWKPLREEYLTKLVEAKMEAE